MIQQSPSWAFTQTKLKLKKGGVGLQSWSLCDPANQSLDDSCLGEDRRPQLCGSSSWQLGK